jgi:hypothetical protein
MPNVYVRGKQRLFVDRNNGTVGAGILVSGSVAKIAQNATIPISGSVNLLVNPASFLSPGLSDFVILQGVAGTLVNSSGVYTFTPSLYPAAPVPLAVNATIYPFQKNRTNNPTIIGTGELNEDQGVLGIKGGFSALRMGISVIKFGDKFSGWIFSFRDLFGRIAFGLKRDGSLYLQGLQLGDKLKLELKDKFSGFAISVKDKQGKIAFAIKYSGAVVVNVLSSKSLTLSNFRFVEELSAYTKNIWSLRDSAGNTAIALRKSGTTYVNKIETQSIVDNGVLSPYLANRLTISHFLRYLAARSFQVAILTINGQSNSVGSDGIRDNTSSGFQGYIDTTQIYGNYKLLDSGSAPLYDGTGDVLSLVPLIEPLRPVTNGQLGGELYPNNIDGQTVASPIANEFSQKMSGFVSAVASTGQAGQVMTQIKKGGTGNSWAKMLYEVNAFKTLLTTASKTYKIGPHFLIHGEGDSVSTTYKADLYSYCADLQTDLRAITGQPEAIPLVLSQQNSFPPWAGGDCLSAQAQFEAGRDHPLIVCAAPTYQYKFLPQAAPNSGSGVHRDAWAFRREGIKLEQAAMAEWVFGQEWTGLRPRGISVASNRIRVLLDVPVGPLRFDPNIFQQAQMNGSPNPWVAGKGFEVVDSSGAAIVIQQAFIVANNEIELVLPKNSAPARVRYAWTLNNVGGTGAWPGVTPAGRDTGRCGSVCDSDPYQGYDRQAIDCGVTSGSAAITTTANKFLNVGWYDRVHGSGFVEPTIVKDRISDVSFTLSNPWTGATGTVPLIFHSDQSNYLVAFDLPVGYSGA